MEQLCTLKKYGQQQQSGPKRESERNTDPPHKINYVPPEQQCAAPPGVAGVSGRRQR